jgi:hypothetical protein
MAKIKKPVCIIKGCSENAVYAPQVKSGSWVRKKGDDERRRLLCSKHCAEYLKVHHAASNVRLSLRQIGGQL